MLTWTIRNRNGVLSFPVYVDDAEAKRYNIVPIPLENAHPGDYCRSDNGYFLPVTSRTSMKHKKKQDLWVQICFPNFTYKNTLYADSGKFRYKTFIWSREPRDIQRDKKFVTGRDKLFALFLSEGMDIDTAMNKIYKGKLSTTQRNRAIGRMLDNPFFIKYIKEKNIVDTLKKRFETNGANDKYFVGELKKILSDKNESATLRLRVIEIFGNVLLQEEGLINQLADRTQEPKLLNPSDELMNKFNAVPNVEVVETQ